MAVEKEGDPFDQELHTEVCRCLFRLLDTPEPEYASALRRVEVENATIADYARESQITPNNAAVRVHRAGLELKR